MRCSFTQGTGYGKLHEISSRVQNNTEQNHIQFIHSLLNMNIDSIVSLLVSQSVQENLHYLLEFFIVIF